MSTITAEDVTRREVIADYRVLGEPPSADLQGLVQLAATMCNVSTAVINIIDDRFQHQIASVGFEPATCTREDSMCAVVFREPGHVVVTDAREDDRFKSNPFVTGEVAHVRFYASSPLITPSGIPIGTLCVFDEDAGDLTPARSEGLKLLAGQVVDVLELRRITRELAESNEQLARFAGQVSHDLRNPLTALSGFLELATDSPDMANAPQAARALARAESAANRMTSMVADLLDYARLGGASPKRSAVDVEGIVRAVVEDLQTPLVQTAARISVDARVEVVGDPTLLRALVQNLVANAVKFSAASGVSPYIEIGAMRLARGGWRITVDDNGPGIAIEERERVFDLMERGTADEVEGLGIGLSTCQRIVEAHGGHIGIDDSPLGGARVWVVLPDTRD
ncbi:GAF domain-containing sensor histidine kinase [Microbacterium sp. cx-55]|uniref:sensor histidine kinase n=1 Tax=unclassified Microbacterium TaxID=2609290 RepID=UPI001CC01C08|nr:MULTISPECIES: GAF domain-containing sensor histidine kinase [unclassified Microbacterium]MBZ4488588.1 GAF domain-containing sensor histidine kinase [Microbacterium sp. cx-55]MCC4909729.1 GAF domain-containing sensor histidine kinase [Microbacterium sp. cx-59]UGB36167.1 GAF domain-containing sensor histidine kinase [Microbacterium sp. cx-55]